MAYADGVAVFSQILFCCQGSGPNGWLLRKRRRTPESTRDTSGGSFFLCCHGYYCLLPKGIIAYAEYVCNMLPRKIFGCHGADVATSQLFICHSSSSASSNSYSDE